MKKKKKNNYARKIIEQEIPKQINEINKKSTQPIPVVKIKGAMIYFDPVNNTVKVDAPEGTEIESTCGEGYSLLLFYFG